MKMEIAITAINEPRVMLLTNFFKKTLLIDANL